VHGTKQAVLDAWLDYTDPLEGGAVTNFMYLDFKGLVTTVYGSLVDPVGYALSCPWRTMDGRPATEDEVRADFARVKLRQDLKLRGGMVYRDISRLRLDELGIQQVVQRKIKTAVFNLRTVYPAWSTWCADAQMAVLSKAWACGAKFGYAGWPKLHVALLAQDWRLAADETPYGNAHGTVAQRGEHEIRMLLNAARVTELGCDPEVLWWPGEPEAPPDSAQPVEVATLPGVGSPGYQATSEAVHEAARRHLERERE